MTEETMGITATQQDAPYQNKPKSRSSDINNERLRGLVERIEKLNAELAILSEDKRDLFLEAKSAGFNPNVLRKLLVVRAQEERNPDKLELEQNLLELYRNALRAAGISVSATKH